MMSKGSKEALTVLIVTHVTHVERVKSGVCGLCTQYGYIQCYVEGVKRSLNSFIQCYVCQNMSKGLKVKIIFDSFNIHSIGMVRLERSKSQLSKTVFGLKIG